MHLKVTKRLTKVILKNCVKVYGLSKFHETSPYVEFVPLLSSKYTGEDATQAEYIFDDNTIVIYYKHMEDAEHLAKTIVHEYQHYLQSPSWMTRYYKMGHYYSDHPYELAAYAEESNWRKVAYSK
jgi:hypothetical protein